MAEFRVEAQENVRYARPINLIIEAESAVEAFITAADHLNRRGFIVNVTVADYPNRHGLHVFSSCGSPLFTDEKDIARIREVFGERVSGNMYVYAVTPYTVKPRGRVISTL